MNWRVSTSKHEIKNHLHTKKKGTGMVLRFKMSSLLFLLLLLFTAMFASADRGMIPIVPDASIFETAQKAIIAWNGEKEILVLSTDVSSVTNTTVLEIMPLPSNPSVIEKGSLESFNIVQYLVWNHMPLSFFGEYRGNETNEVQVTFHEKIGMHEITVVEARNVSVFSGWTSEFLLKNGLSQQVSLKNFEQVIQDYMLRGFHFFVLDLIESSPSQRSVEPILYEFNTSFLYYPLRITSPIGGEGKIILFAITEVIVKGGYSPFTKARYVAQDFSQSIEFEVSNQELSLIDPRIGELFEGKAWMTALRYEGPLGGLTEDIAIKLIKGDLNADGKVDITDLIVAARAFGSLPGHPRWNFEADINKDNVINIIDIVLIANNMVK